MSGETGSERREDVLQMLIAALDARVIVPGMAPAQVQSWQS
jgi:hypothetical protein